MNRKRAEMKIVCLSICFLILTTSMSIVSSNDIIKKNKTGQLDEYPNFPRNKMVMIGKYTNLEEQGSNGFSRRLNITCERGDIVVFGGQWRKSGYSSWVYVRFIRDNYSYFRVSNFFGVAGNGQIVGITFGDFYFS